MFNGFTAYFVSVFVLLNLRFALAQQHFEPRIWKDASESFSIEAKLVDIVGDTVKLLRVEDGLEISIKVDVLSKVDQDFLTKIQRERAPKLDQITTFKELDSIARRQYTAYQVVVLFEHFIKNPNVGDEDKEQARKQLALWEVLAKIGAKKIGLRWVYPDELVKIKQREAELIAEAEAYYAEGEYEDAEKSFVAASVANHDGIKADFRMGLIYALNVHNADSALKCFEKCVQRRLIREDTLTESERANLAASLNNSALSHIRTRSYLTAVQKWTKAMELGHVTNELLQNVGRCLKLSAEKMVKRNDGKLVITLSSQERQRLELLYKEAKKVNKYYEFDDKTGWLYMPLVNEDRITVQIQKPPAVNEAAINRMRVVGYGTGFVVAPGVIMTNAHVADEAEAFAIDTGIPGQENLPAQLRAISREEKLDLALIDCPRATAKPIVFAKTYPTLGDDLRMLGFPLPDNLGTSLKVTSGIVTAHPPHRGLSPALSKFQNYLLYQGTINPGNSGGPAINIQGQVVAVNTAILMPKAVGGSYAAGVSSQDALTFLKANVPAYQEPVVAEQKNWADAVTHMSGATVQIKIMATPLEFAAAKKINARNFNRSAYEDITCMACYGSQLIECPVGTCSLGTVRGYRQDVETFPNGAKVVKNVPIRVTCDTCNGRGKVGCPYCTGGIDPALR